MDDNYGYALRKRSRFGHTVRGAATVIQRAFRARRNRGTDAAYLPAAVSAASALYLQRQRSGLKRAPSSGAASTILMKPIQRETVRMEGNSCKSMCNYGTYKSPISRGVKMLTAPQEFSKNNGGGNVQSAVGLQYAFSYAWYDTSVLQSIEALSPSLPIKTSRVLHESVHGELLIANSAESTCTLCLYDVVARRDLHRDSTGAGGLASPTGAWSVGVNDQGGGANDWKTIGGLPLQSELFNQFYKVVKVTRIELNPGGILRHLVDFKPNTVVHNEVTYSNDYGLRGLTCYTVGVMYGQPAHDSTTITSVSITAASLDIVQSSRYRYRYLQESATNYTQSNSLPGSFAVGPQFVNDEVGQTIDAAGLHPGTLLS